MTRLVRSGNCPIFQSTAPEWLEALLLRGPVLARLVGHEDAQSILFADRLREAALCGHLRGTFSHLPHEVGGGTKNAALRYSLAKALGLVTGSFDYVFVWEDGGGWIEMKRSKAGKTADRAYRPAGRLSDAQKGFQKWCQQENVRNAVVTSAAEGLQVLRDWRVLLDRD